MKNLIWSLSLLASVSANAAPTPYFNLSNAQVESISCTSDRNSCLYQVGMVVTSSVDFKIREKVIGLSTESFDSSILSPTDLQPTPLDGYGKPSAKKFSILVRVGRENSGIPLHRCFKMKIGILNSVDPFVTDSSVFVGDFKGCE